MSGYARAHRYDGPSAASGVRFHRAIGDTDDRTAAAMHFRVEFARTTTAGCAYSRCIVVKTTPPPPPLARLDGNDIIRVIQGQGLANEEKDTPVELLTQTCARVIKLYKYAMFAYSRSFSPAKKNRFVR